MSTYMIKLSRKNLDFPHLHKATFLIVKVTCMFQCCLFMMFTKSEIPLTLIIYKITVLLVSQITYCENYLVSQTIVFLVSQNTVSPVSKITLLFSGKIQFS